MGIEIAGGVYCPLSPRDPEERLLMLVTETRARVVLVHWLTGGKFGVNFSSLSIDEVLSVYESKRDQNVVALERSARRLSRQPHGTPASAAETRWQVTAAPSQAPVRQIAKA